MAKLAVGLGNTDSRQQTALEAQKHYWRKPPLPSPKQPNNNHNRTRAEKQEAVTIHPLLCRHWIFHRNPVAMASHPAATTAASQSTISAKVEDNADFSTTSLSPSNGSQLEAIWKAHLDQYRRLDDLEKRVDERSVRLRRRVTNLLETAPTHRLSHLRLFVSHHTRSEASNALVSAHSIATVEGTKKWTLSVEGKLLVGHIDHESATAFDDRLKKEFQRKHNLSSNHPSMLLATSETTSTTVPTEEEEPVKPIQFTHFFDKMVAQFQSVYQPIESKAAAGAAGDASSDAAATPKTSAAKASASSKKKSRSAKRQKTAVVEVEEQATPEQRLLIYTEPKEFIWNKTVTTISNAPGKPAGITTTTTTQDAHAFFVHYDSPPAGQGMKLFGAVATVQLYPSRGPDQRYKPSKEFAKAFFPKHHSDVPPPILPTTSIAEAKKADSEGTEGDGESTTPKKKRSLPTIPAHQCGPNALENEIHVPTSLTMKEILVSLFTYVQDHRLTSEDDPTMIRNDTKLEQLFQCESMRFQDLQNLLTQKKLIMLLPKPAPIVLKYVMKAQQESPDGEGGQEDAAPMTMDLHNDVYVPNLYPNRVRELLRRIKRREMDYTSQRTKGRYLLMASRAKDESVVKTKIEEAICGEAIGEWPALVCLAKAAPPHSEARITAELDAKIAYLLTEVERSQRAAIDAWELVDLCRTAASAEEVVTGSDESTPKEDDKEVEAKDSGVQGDSMDVDQTAGVINEEQEIKI